MEVALSRVELNEESVKGRVAWLGRRNGVVVKTRLENTAPVEFSSSDDSSFRYSVQRAGIRLGHPVVEGMRIRRTKWWL